MPGDSEPAAVAKANAVRAALLDASVVPLETARAAAQVARLAASVAERGNTNAVSDACVAALIAEAACKGAVWNVRINVASLDASAVGEGRTLLTAARECLDSAATWARATEHTAERTLQAD
jgi:formiminotetrahydrofolate cyclodeaminase